MIKHSLATCFATYIHAYSGEYSFHLYSLVFKDLSLNMLTFKFRFIKKQCRPFSINKYGTCGGLDKNISDCSFI